MEAHPDIKVRIENVTYDAYWPRFLTMVAGGIPPDVIFLESTRLASFASKGTILDLDPFIEADEEINMADFYPLALDALRYKGRLYALPNDIAVFAMFYNKDMFDEAGSIPHPQKGWTWDDFLEISKKLTRDIDGDGKIDQFGSSFRDWRL